MATDTERTSNTSNAVEPDPASPPTTAPRGCDVCHLGVILHATEIRSCVECDRTGRGHDDDREAAQLVRDSLAALLDIRELLWPAGALDESWSPDTIDQVAHRLEFLRPCPVESMADAVRYSGTVVIELTYEDSDGCYDGKVRVDGYVYSISVSAPASGYGPGIAYDSAEAYDRAAHAALSFAAADVEWGQGLEVFTPAAEIGAEGWVIRRRPRGRR